MKVSPLILHQISNFVFFIRSLDIYSRLQKIKSFTILRQKKTKRNKRKSPNNIVITLLNAQTKQLELVQKGSNKMKNKKTIYGQIHENVFWTPNNNNIPNVIPQIGSREGRMYASLTPTFVRVRRCCFPQTPGSKEKISKYRCKKIIFWTSMKIY